MKTLKQLRDCPHTFISHLVKVPTDCEICGRKVWGSTLQCEKCRVRLHPRCYTAWGLMQSLEDPTSIVEGAKVPSPDDPSEAIQRARMPPPSKLRHFWKGRSQVEQQEPLEVSLADAPNQLQDGSLSPEGHKGRHKHVFVPCKLLRPRKCAACGQLIFHWAALACSADRCEEFCHVTCNELDNSPLQGPPAVVRRPLSEGSAAGPKQLWEIVQPLLGSLMAARQTSYTQMARLTLNTKAHSILLDKHAKRLRSMEEFAAQDLSVQVEDAIRLEMLRAVRYACAAYGATLPFYISVGESVKMHALFHGGMDDTDETITRQALAWMGKSSSCLLAYDWYCRPGHPCWMLVHDTTNTALVLALRGTVSMGDVLTDVCGSAVPFLAGQGHGGMVEAANSIIHAVLPEIEAFFTSHSDVPRLMVTGHSLGAGTAVLVSMLLRTSNCLQKTQVVCYAFAPPPVLDEAQASACAEYVTSVVFQGDVVPWLCVNNIDNLLGEINAINATLKSPHVDADLPVPSSMPSSTMSTSSVESPLYLPGRLLWLFDLDYTMHCAEPPRTLFNTVPLHSNMVEDHLPGKYAQAVRWLCCP
eukprot:GGOE01024782.1.p1 GENE.GGOE01024782.1~~GGOE01024782.1.p1  ORF type:complete len:608 (-),score=98.24 GGOE01024782.1:74-1828(-)